MFTIFNESGMAASASSHARSGRRSEPSKAEHLYRDLQAHRDSQEVMLAEAGRAVRSARTPLAEFLLTTILDNETRQLQLLDQMVASLKDSLQWTHSADALPTAAIGSERAAAISSMAELLRLERRRARSARRLAKAFAGIDDGLERALLEASATASESNSRLLRVMLRRLESQPETIVLATAGWPAVAQKAAAARRARGAGDDEERRNLVA